MELNSSDKVNSLISLSNRAYDETKRYRDHGWQILVWTIGLLVGVLAVAARPDFANIVWLGIIFIVVVAGFGIWDINHDYKQFMTNRNLLRECERRLRFHDKSFYGEDSLLPEAWKTTDYQFSKCLPHYVQWVSIIGIIAFYSVYALWYPRQFTETQKQRQEFLLTRIEKLTDRNEEISKKHEALLLEKEKFVWKKSQEFQIKSEDLQSKDEILLNRFEKVIARRENILQRYEELIEMWENQEKIDKTAK